jgi:hypothetical protein
LLTRAVTDANGHAALTWTWSGPVWVSVPQLSWSRAVLAADLPAPGHVTPPPVLTALLAPYDLPPILPQKEQ